MNDAGDVFVFVGLTVTDEPLPESPAFVLGDALHVYVEYVPEPPLAVAVSVCDVLEYTGDVTLDNETEGRLW